MFNELALLTHGR